MFPQKQKRWVPPVPGKGRGGCAEHAVIWEPLRQRVQMGLTAANLYLPLQSNIWERAPSTLRAVKVCAATTGLDQGHVHQGPLKEPCTALSELCSCEQLRTCNAAKAGRCWVTGAGQGICLITGPGFPRGTIPSDAFAGWGLA